MFNKKKNLKAAIAVACMSASFGTFAATEGKPNFVTIMIDDMGFSDIGSFGGEINTPNLDRLVTNGTQLTNYYSAATSGPARGMFFTGRDSHPAGVGNLKGFTTDRPPQQGLPEYSGALTTSLPSFPQLLQGNGYYTAMTGKWHLGSNPGQYPIDHGFTDSLVLLPGGDVHFLSDANGDLITTVGFKVDSNGNLVKSSPYVKNNDQLNTFPANAFSTDFYTDEAINMLDNRPDKTKPFYVNIAHIASHVPFQAPADLIASYLPVYSQGWDVLRENRFAKLKTLGLVKQDAVLPPRDIEVTPWDKLTPDQQAIEAKRLAIYAALVDKLDQSVGKLIQHLKDTGEFDNTVFFVMSDNGAPAQEPGNGPAFYSNLTRMGFTRDTIQDIDNMGTASSYIPPSAGFAMLSNTPFKRYKTETFEAGIHTAAFVYSAKADPRSRGTKYDCLSSVMDISATILKMSKTAYPASYNGNPISPLDGIPMNNIFKGDLSCKQPDRELGFEQDSAKMMRTGDWKLSQQWITKSQRYDDHVYLFNLANDPFEEHDLSQAYPEDYQRMVSLYNKFAAKNNIVNVGPRIFYSTGNLASLPSSTNGMILGGAQVNYSQYYHPPVLPDPGNQSIYPTPAPKMGDIVDIAAEIYPPAEQRKLGGKVMVAAYFKPTKGTKPGHWTAYQRTYNANGKIVSNIIPITDSADGSTSAPDFSKVPAFLPQVEKFTSRLQLPIYEGKVTSNSFKVGTYYYWVGYELSDGTAEQSISPITVPVVAP